MAVVSTNERTRLLTAEEVAAALRVAPRTVRRWGQDGVLCRVRLGPRLTRYRADQVAALLLLNDGEVEPEPVDP